MANNQYTFGSVKERFLSQVEMVTESGCWIWMATIDGGGYGKFGLGARPGKRLSEGARMRSAHRISYELLVGPVPDGLDLDHLCRVRCCVNPAHLEPVTRKENCRRGIAVEVNTARNRAKTHCPRGHEYTAQNTAIRPINKARACRTCLRMWDKERYPYRKEQRRLAKIRTSLQQTLAS